MRSRVSKVKNLAYEGATRGNRASGFSAPRSGPNRTVVPEHGSLRDRTLAGHRNMPLIFSGIEKNVVNEVGSGVAIRAKSSDPVFNAVANALWQKRIQYADPELVINWHGQLTQAVRARRTQGEVFIRRRYRSLSDGLPVPYQNQILESCFCPITLNIDLANSIMIGDSWRDIEAADSAGIQKSFYLSNSPVTPEQSRSISTSHNVYHVNDLDEVKAVL